MKRGVYTSREREKHSRYVSVRRSRISGRGAFARCPIRKGTVVGAMRGPAVAHDGVHVLWQPAGRGKWTLIEVRGPLKYMNHSATPNVELFEDLRGITRVRALRKIAPGEELTFEYDTSDGDPFTLRDPDPRVLSPVSRRARKLR